MTPLKPIENLFAVEVAENAQDFQLTPRYSPETGNDYTLLVWWNSIGHSAQRQLPYADYEILFTTSSATEQQAAGVVLCTQSKVRGAKVQMAFYKNYDHEFSSFGSAIASLESLLRSNGLDATKNYLLIKKTT